MSALTDEIESLQWRLELEATVAKKKLEAKDAEIAFLQDMHNDTMKQIKEITESIPVTKPQAE